MNKSTDGTTTRTYILGTGESENLDRESRHERGRKVNKVDLPGFRSTFHGVEVAIDHNQDKVRLLKTTCQRNNPVAKE